MKIEVDTDPPPGFETEIRYILDHQRRNTACNVRDGSISPARIVKVVSGDDA